MTQYASTKGGGGGLTSPIAAGTAAAPPINFVSATTSGLYSSGANTVDIAANGFRVANFTATGTVTNYITLNSAATGVQPSYSVSGTDTNIGTSFKSKGFAGHSFVTNVSGTDYQLFIFGADALPTGATNYPQFSAVNAGSYPYLQAAGGDANIGFDFYGKGTGPIRFQSSVQIQGQKTLTVQGVKSAANTASSAAINTTATYITPAFSPPANSLNAGDCFEIIIHGTTTSSVASNTSVFTIRMGTAGTTADTSVLTLTAFSAATGSAIPFVFKAMVIVRTTGAPGTCVAYAELINSGITGISNGAQPSVVGNGTTANITTTGALFLGVSFASSATTTTSTFHTMTIRKIL